MRGDGSDRRVEAEGSDVEAFRDWSRRYERAVGASDEAALVAIGREMGDWLERRGLDGVISGDGGVTFAVAEPPSADEMGFLDAPWELLSDANGPLARRSVKPYRPARRIGAAKTASEPAHSDLFILFMAAAPADQQELSFEGEEAGLMEATEGLDMRLVVEESGALAPLEARISTEAPIEGLHLSCHGDIRDGIASLAFEDDYGEMHGVTIDDLAPALGAPPPGLVFLSACRTAEQSPGAATFAIELSRVVPNVVGWDGSVSDRDAIAFAETFYRDLCLGRTVPEAAASARRALPKLKDENPEAGRHWHLARVYLGPGGGGPLRKNGLPARPPRETVGTLVFLGGKEDALVASPDVFVGRRRETQKVLRAFNENKHVGVLLRGMGRLGKSSLAARVGDRLMRYEVALVFKAYDAKAIFSAMVEAVAPQWREGLRGAWADKIENPAALYDALQAILAGPASMFDEGAGKRPILLVIDDLERILEEPRPGEDRTRVKAAYRDVLAMTLRAFEKTCGRTRSRLLLTSRYNFTLPGERGDMADRLFDLQLPPMNDRQRKKLVESETRVAHDDVGVDPLAGADRAAHLELLQRSVACAEGNPGLQALLMRPVLRGDPLAETAIAAVEAYRERGAPPQAGDLGQFFVQLALDNYHKSLTPEETAQARAGLLFTLPVPWPVMLAAGRAVEVGDPKRAIERLAGLGCFDAYHLPGREQKDAAPELAVNALLRPLYAPLSEAEHITIAKEAVPALYAALVDKDGDLPPDPRAVELAQLAILAKATPNIIDKAAQAASYYLFNRTHAARAALELVEASVAALEAQDASPSAYLLRQGIEASNRLGEAAKQDAFLARGAQAAGGDERAMAMLQYHNAERLIQTGDLDAALEQVKAAEQVFERLGDIRSRAVTMGQIADILFARGELDEALRINAGEYLPIVRQLLDQDGIAHALYNCARIPSQAGNRLGRDRAIPLRGTFRILRH